MDTYFGTYHRFETPSKKDAALLLGADNLVGDRYTIEFELDKDVHTAWLVSRFNQRIGYFDPQFSRRLSILQASGLKLCALLSFVAYTETPAPGSYWGEMAVIGYLPSQEAVFDPFITTVAKRLEDNVRTNVDFGPDGVKKLMDSQGTWVPDQTVPMPATKKGTVILKRRRSLSDKAIEQGRKGNKGCYIVSWIFLLALVTLIIYGLHAFGLF